MNALTSSAPFSTDHFGMSLPRDLRRHAAGLSWPAFRARFDSAAGPVKLGSWTARAGRGGRTTFDATFGIGNAIHAATATSYGPIDALTSMLYDAGLHIEILSFHQHALGGESGPGSDIATFVLCEYDGRREWSMAVERTGAESSIRALIGAANRLHG